MARFLNRALQLLEGLYRFEGSIVGTDQMDLSRPITLVHDTRRGAEILSSFTNADGYMLITATHTHVGAGTMHSNVDPYLVTDLARKARASTRIWALHAFCDTDTTGTFVEAQICRLTPVLPTGSAVSSRPQLLAHFDDPMLAATGAGTNFIVGANAEAVMNGTQFPVNMAPAPAGGTGGIFFASNVTGASLVRLALMCWAGPHGADPPRG